MRVLLVEDNLENARFYKLAMESAGYEVVHKTHGSEGLKAAQKEYFHAIVLDFNLPEMDGVQICMALRNAFHNTPIIALTAENDSIARRKAEIFGFDAFIAKPCTEADLLDTLQILIQDIKKTLSR